jgi:hypothetical protein
MNMKETDLEMIETGGIEKSHGSNSKNTNKKKIQIRKRSKLGLTVTLTN